MVASTVRASTAPSSPTREAIRVTSWLPTKVIGVKDSEHSL